MSSLALTSGWYYICTLYCTPDNKQVIVFMNDKNKNEFMKNLSNYVININRLLKNIKSECKADYIRSEKSSVVIVTDKIASALDLQTIE